MTTFDGDYSVLACIASRMKELEAPLGRTKFQKLVFLLSELFDLKTEYEFRFYNYGPFSSRLAGDIDYLARIDVFDTTFFIDKGLYEIEPGKNISSAGSEKLDATHKDKIQKLIQEFGKKNAADLELLSTLVYVNRFDDVGDNKDALFAKTKALKPKFSDAQINAAFESIKNYLQLSARAA